MTETTTPATGRRRPMLIAAAAAAAALLVGGEIATDGTQRRIAEGDPSVSRYGASWSYTSGKQYPGRRSSRPTPACRATPRAAARSRPSSRRRWSPTS